VQTIEQGRIEVPHVNADANKIRSANYETVLKLQIFFWFTPQLFSRSEHSVGKFNLRVTSRKVLIDLHRFLSN
jgi:hypothetical protein